MPKFPETYLQKAKQHKKTTHKFLKRLKAKPPKNLDQEVNALDEEVFNKIDCLECANCCKTTSPVFKEKDIKRIAKLLGMKRNEFIDHYLQMDTDGAYILKQVPCPFLEEDNKCSIYPDRPEACASFPHTHRTKQRKLLDLTQENYTICPAVYQIVERLKTTFQ